MVMMHAAVTNLRFMLCRVKSIGNENSQFFLLLQTAHCILQTIFNTSLARQNEYKPQLPITISSALCQYYNYFSIRVVETVGQASLYEQQRHGRWS